MKRLFFIGLLAFSAVVAFAQKSSLSVEGTTSKYIGDTVQILTHENFNTPIKVVAKNNKFSARVPLNKVGDMLITWFPKAKNARPVRVIILGVPGEKAQVSFENFRPDGGMNIYVTGSKFYKESDVIDRTLEKMTDEKQIADYVVNFIKQHPGSDAPMRFLRDFNYDDALRMQEAFSPEVRNGRMKDYLEDHMSILKKRHDEEEAAAKKQAAGIVAPDFTLNDLNGKPLSLSSLKGKYVVLDFWGSWCIWCIRGIPKMKEYYNKYKGKFEILSIDCNDTDQKWRDAVKKYELPWLHVYNPRDSKVLSDYGIQGFPTKILVGPDGKIVKTIVGEDPAFYTFLDDTFGK